MGHCIEKSIIITSNCFPESRCFTQHVVCCHDELGLCGVLLPEAVVFLTQDVMGVGVAPDARANNVFQCFAGYGCQ